MTEKQEKKVHKELDDIRDSIIALHIRKYGMEYVYMKLPNGRPFRAGKISDMVA